MNAHNSPSTENIAAIKANYVLNDEQCEGLEEGAGGRGEIHKLTAAAATSFVLDKAVQIHGGAGFMRDTEVNRLYRTGRVLEVGAGTQEVRKLIISGELLKH